MRAIPLSLTIIAAALPLAGCGDRTAGDAVRARYDNRADAVEQQAKQQPTQTAKKIYEARADALREEGKDREKGLEGREPSKGPRPAGQAGEVAAPPQ